MSEYMYSLLKHIYACAAVCDEVTEGALETQLEKGTFPYRGPPRNRRFERGPVSENANSCERDCAGRPSCRYADAIPGVVQEDIS